MQQAIGVQTAVSCVQVAHLGRTVLSVAIVRMAPNVPVKMVGVTAQQVGRARGVTGLAMRNSTAGIAALHADV